MEAFSKAFAAAGGSVSADVQIHTPAQGERGVFVLESALANLGATAEPLVHIPASLVITAAMAAQSNIVAQCCAQLESDAASELVLLALFLLTERVRGTESQWQWYIAALPREGINALTFDDCDICALASTPLRTAVDAKLRQLRRQYGCFVGTLERWRQDQCLSSSVSFEDYCWAHAIVLSRAISLHSFVELAPSSLPPLHDDCDRALLPFLDMFNHSSEPNTVWTIDHDGSVCIGTTSYQSGYSIDVAGQRLVELCFSYGEKPNTEWLYEYGFVPPNNRHDVWPYFVERQGSPQLLEIKQMWLQELQLVPRIMLPDPISLSDGQSCVTPAALLVLCLAALDDCSDQFAQAVGKLELDPPYFSVDGLLIDNDEKLLQVPGLADRALSQCASRLCAQSAAMRAARSPLTATSQAVLDYLDAESHLTDCIATAIKSR